MTICIENFLFRKTVAKILNVHQSSIKLTKKEPGVQKVKNKNKLAIRLFAKITNFFSTLCHCK